MAKGKDFTNINTGRANKVYSNIETATSKRGQQGKASPQEAHDRANKLKTQGRKGCKAIRINMAFTPDNHQFIKVMAKISGQTMTEFTNLVIERYREEHPGIYEQVQAILDQI